ncbi:MAG: hypothetical protein K0R28_3646 [Paenibacillus sp.]|nr:hypothetical protein [Paenibacillus sp.]
MSSEPSLSLLYPPGVPSETSGSAAADPSVISALAAESLFGTMRSAGRFKPNQKSPIVFFTDNIDVISYRLDVMEDLLNNEPLTKLLRTLLPDLEDMKELQQMDSAPADDTASALTGISEIELYIGLMDRLYEFFRKVTIPLVSAGFRELVSELKRIHESESYRILKTEYGKISTSIRSIKSITVGVNLDEQFRPYEAGVVAVHTAKFQSGKIIDKLLRMNFGDGGYNCLAPLEVVGKGLTHEQSNGFRAAVNHSLNAIFRSAIKSWRPVIRAYTIAESRFLVRLADEIRFLLGGVTLIQKLRDAGVPVCKPQVERKERKAFEINGLYNPAIVLDQQKCSDEKSPNRIVLNPLKFDENGMIYILTGPNQGGKTVFVQAVGIAQLMFQLGLFVPAFSAVMSPVDRLFVHFPDESDRKSTGRFGDECQRLMHICNKLTEHSLLLMDETFSGTSASEATYIAEQVLLGLSTAGCRVLFSTHLHDLARSIDELNKRADTDTGRIDSLTAELETERSDTGRRSYKISRSRPAGYSYARDIAEKYGLTYEGLMVSLHKRNLNESEAR